jgi:hypothetical protein
MKGKTMDENGTIFQHIDEKQLNDITGGRLGCMRATDAIMRSVPRSEKYIDASVEAIKDGRFTHALDQDWSYLCIQSR